MKQQDKLMPMLICLLATAIISIKSNRLRWICKVALLTHRLLSEPKKNAYRTSCDCESYGKKNEKS